MNRNHVGVILIQLFIVVSEGQRKFTTNNEGTSSVSFASFQYPSAGYYSTHVSPYQYPYSSAPFVYPPASPSAAATQFLYPPQSPYPNASAFPQGLSTQQQYYLGPMNAAQAQYLTAYIQKLAHPPSAPQVQIPSTPTAVNASIFRPTPPTNIASFDPVNSTDVKNSSTVEPANTTQPHINASNPILSAGQVSDTNSSDPILAAARAISSGPIPSYRIGNELYNPFASTYASFPSQQPFYPPGYGPWNPFVLNPAVQPVSSSNGTQQPNAAKTVPPSGQESSSATAPTIISSTGESGMSDLPPQVKEFIEMIPDILSMPETSQLNPSTNNAIIHQLGGGLENVLTPPPRLFRRPKTSLRIKKKHYKPLRRRGHFM